ncbi:hypothetical protein HELRODRAFT_166542 [Helobdella robusta]|uniref:Serine/threonine-protein phosphatase n=1 Tax=Helobdella robusta TaxID=6412 RepID=T1EY81_HELRO|nr:hypothetical protein HELRODRAFT_166542 [Helobdella robusta]ESO11541.1 hypothetical protein HELRODRAFT_166542 [Helobdella robusta]
MRFWSFCPKKNYIKLCDDLLKILLDDNVRNNPKAFTSAVTQRKILALCAVSRETFMSQSMLVEMDAPVNICGDIHGQYVDLLELFRVVGNPSEKPFLFLGDYVDRGKQSLECICLLFIYKVKYPKTFFLLRGNHEEKQMNEVYGFSEECENRYSSKLWQSFIDVFNCMPVAAVVSKKIFCCHGGLSPSLTSLKQIKRIRRPKSVPRKGIMCDLLWADPKTDCKVMTGWSENVDRGISCTFGRDVVQNFLKRFDFDLVCRAHEVVDDGYEFYSNRGLVTIFSAPLYTSKFDNDGAVLSVDENLRCSFHILRPSVIKSHADQNEQSNPYK